MAEKINNYFADLGINLAERIPASLVELDLDFKGDYPPFALESITESDIRKLLDNMSSNKSTGIDGVPIRFLKMARDLSLKLLTNIINKSLATVTVPTGWEKACITLLFRQEIDLSLEIIAPSLGIFH